MKINSLEVSKKIKRIILDTAFKAGHKSAHIGGALSLSDILSVLYANNFIKFDCNNPKWKNRDRLILSKGHACLAYYALLHIMGFINEKDLDMFENDGADLLGHPIKNLEKGIEYSTGSLGIGVSISVGVALAAKLKLQDHKVYAILGDGELNEGSVWEAFMCAAKYGLNNLTFIIDKNNHQQTGTTEFIMRNENLKEKLLNFNMNAQEIDGHNHNDIEKALKNQNENPKVIIANTIKGKGFSFAENNNIWHHSVLTEKIYKDALIKIDNDKSK